MALGQRLSTAGTVALWCGIFSLLFYSDAFPWVFYGLGLGLKVLGTGLEIKALRQEYLEERQRLAEQRARVRALRP